MGEINFRLIKSGVQAVGNDTSLEEIAAIHGAAFRLSTSEINLLKEHLSSNFPEAKQKIDSDAHFNNRFANRGYLPDGSLDLIRNYFETYHPEEYNQAKSRRTHFVSEGTPINWDNRNETGYRV